MSQCAWCGDPATTQVNIAKQRTKLKLVDACADHARMVDGERERLRLEREKKARERKEGVRVWW